MKTTLIYAKITDASWTQQVYEKTEKNTYHCNRRHIAASCLSVQVDFKPAMVFSLLDLEI